MSDDLRELGSLVSGRYGVAHEHHARIASTNDRAFAWLREGAPHGAVVTADAQDAGRGRRGRSWESPAGLSLYVSVLLRPGVAPAAVSYGALGLAVGVGLAEGLEARDMLRSAVALKWPNDLMVAGRKLGGILCEARWVGASPQIVVGFGINVHAQRFEPPLDERATTVAEQLAPSRSGSGDAALGRATLLAGLLASLESAVEPFFVKGFAAVRERYLSRCVTLGRAVVIADAPGVQAVPRGIAERLDDEGALWVRPESGGDAVRVASGDVWLAADVPAGVPAN